MVRDSEALANEEFDLAELTYYRLHRPEAQSVESWRWRLGRRGWTNVHRPPHLLMIGVELAVSTVMQSMLQAGAREAVSGLRIKLGRRPGRVARRGTYQVLQVKLAQAQLRAGLIQTLHRSHGTPAGVVTGLIAYPTMVRTLDNALTDMAEVMDAWLSVRGVAPVPLAAAADETVMAMAGLLEHPARAWWQSGRRRQNQLNAEAGRRFDEAVTEFVRLTVADTGRTRADRRAARRRMVTVQVPAVTLS